MKRAFYLLAFVLFCIFSLSKPVFAANWVELQGVEKKGSEPTLKIIGFIQPEWQKTDGTKIQDGPWQGQNAVFNVIRPRLEDNSDGSLFRARLAAKGRINQYINYFTMVDAGNNALTRNVDTLLIITDASLTFDYIGPKIRIGQFKTPGSEEAMQSKYDYINFALSTNQLVLERYYDGDGSDPQNKNAPNGAFGAFRDIGIELFDTYKRDEWEHTWAAMVGNGNGIARSDNDSHKDKYLYWSSEWVFSGKGPQRDGWKLFGWWQDGKRTLTEAGAGTYDRTRHGLGTTFKKEKWRSTIEWINAGGMILSGTDGAAVPGSSNNANTAISSFNLATDDKAEGWWADVSYRLTKNTELLLRYDVLNRTTNIAANERQSNNITLGYNWFFDKKSKVMFNYEYLNSDAPNLDSQSVANNILDGVDNRLSVQVFYFFRLH
ncbi:MAG: porin [endosymbiont of Galathealinum brachiosum]|uniref:Porin n=1 Tax=endosymbiont of Galathealinum brachiosum TaxID=2200906 RepID=A0A370DLD8_9GAMM|nr:MAG: porin [endosymbiont of Galathealinum brachiosum]